MRMRKTLGNDRETVPHTESEEKWKQVESTLD